MSKNRNLVHHDNWETPKIFYDLINERFDFNFDPCPICYEEITPDKDGLILNWKERNFVNPPYSLKLKTGFVLKGIEEFKKGNTSVFLIPVSTSTKLFHESIQPYAQLEFIKGRIPFIGVNGKGQYVNWHLTEREAPEGVEHIKAMGMHDSMLAILKPTY